MENGRTKCLINLSEINKEEILPLFEIPFPKPPKDDGKKHRKKKEIAESILQTWVNKPFFFSLAPEWYHGSENRFSTYVQQFSALGIDEAIPVFDLSTIDKANVLGFAKKRMAIRVHGNEFSQIKTYLNSLFDSLLDRTITDLILDLKYVTSEDLFVKTSALSTVLASLDQADQFHSIIISSASFPKATQVMNSQLINHFLRNEVEVHNFAVKLTKQVKFNYIYSDYGPTNLEDAPYVLGMSPNFKIRYTTLSEYLYLKGLPVKKGGLDYKNVRALCKQLVDSGEFMGANYSWGDENIYNLSQNLSSKSGSLTTWVGYSLNHHITLILNNV